LQSFRNNQQKLIAVAKSTPQKLNFAFPFNLIKFFLKMEYVLNFRSNSIYLPKKHSNKPHTQVLTETGKHGLIAID